MNRAVKFVSRPDFTWILREFDSGNVLTIELYAYSDTTLAMRVHVPMRFRLTSDLAVLRSLMLTLLQQMLNIFVERDDLAWQEKVQQERARVDDRLQQLIRQDRTVGSALGALPPGSVVRMPEPETISQKVFDDAIYRGISGAEDAGARPAATENPKWREAISQEVFDDALGALPPWSVIRRPAPEPPIFRDPWPLDALEWVNDQPIIVANGRDQVQQWREAIPQSDAEPIEQGPDLPPSDTGLEGAVPLPPMDQPWDPDGVAVWTAQNRRIVERTAAQTFLRVRNLLENVDLPERGPDLPPSDTGLEGAIQLPPPTWTIPPEPEDWAEQNRRVNALLMGRAP